MPNRARSTVRIVLFAVVTALVLLPLEGAAAPIAGGAGTAHAAIGAAARPAGTFDVRKPIASPRALAASVAIARANLGRALGHMGVFEIDPRTGTPRVVANLDGTLTGPSTAPSTEVALGFVRRHLAAFGLSNRDLRTFVLADRYTDDAGITHLSWTQRARGVTAFDNGLQAAVLSDGRLLGITGPPAHDLGAGVNVSDVRLTGAQAAASARASAGAAAVTRRGDAAHLVLFHGGRSTLAWQTITSVSPVETDLSVVDATTGAVLWRTNLVHADSTGTGLAWDLFPSDQVPLSGGTQHAVSFPVAGSTKLSGNNAHVYKDVNDDNQAAAGDEIPAASGLDWSFPASLDTTTATQNCDASHACTWGFPAANSWKPNVKEDAAQVYYYLNHYHDHLLAAPIGFTEAQGNFQQVNASGKGKGGDAVQAQIFDGAATNHGLPDIFHYNNANFFTPPDGHKPVMQLYLFHKDPSVPGWPAANAGDDASVVYHEYTHGLSGRLETFPSGVEALGGAQAGAMGEAWSDWYALDFLANEGFVVDGPTAGDVKEGEWITGGEGIRFEGIDCRPASSSADCPGGFHTGGGGFTYGDFGKVFQGPEVHSDGEIWGQTLWDLRRTLGSTTAEKLITRGMDLAPPNPSFLDARNAILQASVATGGSGAQRDAIWKVFAKRGMGYFASTSGSDDESPVQSVALPPSCATDPCGRIAGTITDRVTGKPVAGATVAIGGHDSGFPGTDLADKTDASGRYSIRKVPFHTYADLIIDKKGIETRVLHGVKVNGIEKLNRAVYRDWAAQDGGAKVKSFTPPNYTAFGCGPSGAIDRSLSSGWGSDAPNSTIGSNVTGPRAIVVRLPKAVDITAFAVDPGATCGDGPASGVKAFDIYTKTAHGSWVRAYRRTTGLPQGVLTAVKPVAGKKNVRFVKFVMRSDRGDPNFMDMSELSVRGR